MGGESDIQALRARVQQLEQKVKELEAGDCSEDGKRGTKKKILPIPQFVSGIHLSQVISART
jgi:hypothetical protein